MKLFQTEVDAAFVLECYKVSLTSVAIIVFLEGLIWDSTWASRLRKESEVKALYLKGVVSNALHFLLIAPVAYGITCAHVEASGYYMPDWVAVPGGLLCQSVGYACCHYWMHKFVNP
mmetsp:Transcript_34764/g.54315  ORF Transcript_34764/g.54315 Transcript_34764/m.54315 type:complete len:117 (+) Transcript_34764:194-544(+)